MRKIASDFKPHFSLQLSHVGYLCHPFPWHRPAKSQQHSIHKYLQIHIAQSLASSSFGISSGSQTSPCRLLKPGHSDKCHISITTVQEKNNILFCRCIPYMILAQRKCSAQKRFICHIVTPCHHLLFQPVVWKSCCKNKEYEDNPWVLGWHLFSMCQWLGGLI